jgi:O-antigen ligase
LGNYDRTVLTEFDAYLQAGIPGLVFLAFFIFYLIWVGHYSKCISEEEENSEYVKPEKFCVEVEGF